MANHFPIGHIVKYSIECREKLRHFLHLRHYECAIILVVRTTKAITLAVVAPGRSVYVHHFPIGVRIRCPVIENKTVIANYFHATLFAFINELV